MSQYFISDLHLSETSPRQVELLQQFIQQIQLGDELYILGDLFELWIGDDDKSRLAEQVKFCLAEVNQKGAKLFLMHGNRDFLIGNRFAREVGGQLIPDPFLAQINGKPTLLMHGDTLCTDDIDYQAYRKKIRQPWVLWLIRCLPLSLRQHLATKLRDHTKAAVDKKMSDMMDVNQHAVEAVMQLYQINTLIHGHTHRPAIHQFYHAQCSYTRIVLGAWDNIEQIFYYQADKDTLSLL